MEKTLGVEAVGKRNRPKKNRKRWSKGQKDTRKKKTAVEKKTRHISRQPGIE